MNNRSLFIGILGGLAAGLLAIATVNAGPLAFILMFIAAAAVYIATMGWGHRAGIASVVAATAMIAFMSDLEIALSTSVLLFVPAAWTGFAVNLGHRPAGGPGIEWYPLGRILFQLILILAAGFILSGLAAGITVKVLEAAFTELFREIASTQPDLPGLTPEMVDQRAIEYARIVPLVAPGTFLLMHVLTAFISAGITRRSGQLARERGDVAATTVLPPQAAIVLVAGLGGVLLLDGTPWLAAAVLLGLSVSGYAVAGLAVMHHRLRGNPAATLILVIAYGAIITMAFPLFIFTVLGLMRSLAPSGPQPPART